LSALKWRERLWAQVLGSCSIPHSCIMCFVTKLKVSSGGGIELMRFCSLSLSLSTLILFLINCGFELLYDLFMDLCALFAENHSWDFVNFGCCSFLVFVTGRCSVPQGRSSFEEPWCGWCDYSQWAIWNLGAVVAVSGEWHPLSFSEGLSWLFNLCATRAFL